MSRARKLAIVAAMLLLTATAFSLGRSTAPQPIPQPANWRVRVVGLNAGQVPAEVITLFDRGGILAGPSSNGGLDCPVPPGGPVRIEVVRLDGDAVNILLGDW